MHKRNSGGSDPRRALIVVVAFLAIACSSAPAPTASPTTGPAATPTPTITAGVTASAALPTPTLAPSPSTSPAPTVSPGPTPSTAPSPTATIAPSPTPTIAPSPTPPTSAPVEVVAGGGTADPAGGGPATDARLGRLTGLAVGSDGTIWIVDANAGQVYTVTPDGLIHVVASGMYGPQGMGLGADEVPYIAERGGNRLLATNGSGDIKIIAGNLYHSSFRGDGGPAKRAYLSQPYDVVADAAGNLYIADATNERVRFIDALSGEISTIAGNGTAGFSGDGEPATSAELYSPEALAVDPAGTELFIADYGSSHLRRVDLTTGIITTVAGSGAGSTAYDPNLTGLQVGPTRLVAVALDAQGNVYLPVFFTNKGQMVMRMDQSGNLTVVAGGGSSSGPGVLATDWAIPPVEALEIDQATGALLIGSNDGKVYRIPGVAAPAP